MSVLDKKVSAYLDRFAALEARCDQNENLHTLGNETESLLESVISAISTMPATKKAEQKVVIERKLMSATRTGSASWKHIANFALERFKVLAGNS